MKVRGNRYVLSRLLESSPYPGTLQCTQEPSASRISSLCWTDFSEPCKSILATSRPAQGISTHPLYSPSHRHALRAAISQWLWRDAVPSPLFGKIQIMSHNFLVGISSTHPLSSLADFITHAFNGCLLFPGVIEWMTQQLGSTVESNAGSPKR